VEPGQVEEVVDGLLLAVFREVEVVKFHLKKAPKCFEVAR
jgi:hypothetical protein